jgi:hypothetical protein
VISDVAKRFIFARQALLKIANAVSDVFDKNRIAGCISNAMQAPQFRLVA